MANSFDQPLMNQTPDAGTGDTRTELSQYAIGLMAANSMTGTGEEQKIRFAGPITVQTKDSPQFFGQSHEASSTFDTGTPWFASVQEYYKQAVDDVIANPERAAELAPYLNRQIVTADGEYDKAMSAAKEQLSRIDHGDYAKAHRREREAVDGLIDSLRDVPSSDTFTRTMVSMYLYDHKMLDQTSAGRGEPPFQQYPEIQRAAKEFVAATEDPILQQVQSIQDTAFPHMILASSLRMEHARWLVAQERMGAGLAEMVQAGDLKQRARDELVP